MKFFDFTSEEDFNLDEEYSKLENGSEIRKSPEENKIKDSEEIIKELGVQYVEYNSIKNFEEMFKNVESFLTKYSSETELVTNMTEQERHKLFGYASNLFRKFESYYQNMEFNFELTKKEWHFVDNVLSKKNKYNGNEVFNYWQLREELLTKLTEQFKTIDEEGDAMVVTSVKNMVLLSHLLMKHEENANGRSFYHFKDVLFQIAKMTKLFNAYGVIVERSTKKFTNWVNALNAIDNYNSNEMRLDEIDE